MMIRLFEKLININRPLKILVTGNKGNGKSTFLSSIRYKNSTNKSKFTSCSGIVNCYKNWYIKIEDKRFKLYKFSYTNIVFKKYYIIYLLKRIYNETLLCYRNVKKK